MAATSLPGSRLAVWAVVSAVTMPRRSGVNSGLSRTRKFAHVAPLAQTFLRLFVAVAVFGCAMCDDSTNTSAYCLDEQSCQARWVALKRGIRAVGKSVATSGSVIDFVGRFRSNVLANRRTEMTNGQRERLAQGHPLVLKVTSDLKHAPRTRDFVSNFVRHRTIVTGSPIRLYAVHRVRVPRKMARGGFLELVVFVDDINLLHVFDVHGVRLLEGTDLGHGDGKTVIQMSVESQGNQKFIATGDDRGHVRVHALQLFISEAASNEHKKTHPLGTPGAWAARLKPKVAFSVPVDESTGEAGNLTSLLIIIDQNRLPSYVVGDSSGAISYFKSNTQLRCRMLVTRESGGVRTLVQFSPKSVFWYSLTTYGYFNPSRAEVENYACPMTASPIQSVCLAKSRHVLALANGDVIFVPTSPGQCEFKEKLFKFSRQPLQLFCFATEIMAFQVEETGVNASLQAPVREFYWARARHVKTQEGIEKTTLSMRLQASVGVGTTAPKDFAFLLAGTGDEVDDQDVGVRKMSVAIFRRGDRNGLDLFDVPNAMNRGAIPWYQRLNMR